MTELEKYTWPAVREHLVLDSINKIKHDPVKFDTKDPKEALRQIVGYLRTVNMNPDRAFLEDGETLGYWQCTEWLEGLLEIADECDSLNKQEDLENLTESIKGKILRSKGLKELIHYEVTELIGEHIFEVAENKAEA